MGELNTGTLYIRSKVLEETDDHVSRLSIRCMLNGEQRYRVGGNDHLVTPDNYLVVNQGQHYRTSFRDSEEQEMILVAFKPGSAEALRYSLVAEERQLLDNPFDTAGTVHFFEKTYAKDPIIAGLFERLRQLIDVKEALKRDLDIETIYDALLMRLLLVHNNLKPEVDKIQSSKISTRVELYRRLSVARDYIDANACQAIKLSDIAKVACLSPHHFKRAFYALHGSTPHQYLTQKRLEKAKFLIRERRLEIRDACTAVGFESVSSFIRLFKAHTGLTPGMLQK